MTIIARTTTSSIQNIGTPPDGEPTASTEVRTGRKSVQPQWGRELSQVAGPVGYVTHRDREPGGGNPHEPRLHSPFHRRRGARAAPRRQRPLRPGGGALPHRAEGGPGRAREGAAPLRHHPRLQRLARAAGAPLRRRLRRALHRAAGRQRPLARGDRNAPVRRDPPQDPALPGPRPRGMRRGPGRAGGEVPRRPASAAGSRRCSRTCCPGSRASTPPRRPRSSSAPAWRPTCASRCGRS